MPRQLAFDLPVRESRARGDFFVSDANRLAVARLENTGNWPNGKLVLVGPEGSGKTHLAHVWAEAENAHFLTAVSAEKLPDAPVVLDVDKLTRDDEEPLFHLHNHLAHQNLPFLILARTPPAQWDIALPDLRSRMEATDIARIEPPDDALLSAVLLKLFADRQLTVAPPVVEWLIKNMERSFAEAQRIVVALDTAALEEGRAVTRPLAQRVLGAGQAPPTAR